MTGNAARRQTRRTDIVVWKAAGFNDQGEVTVNSPMSMKARVEKGNRETLDPQGNVVVSFRDINVPEEVPIGSLVWIGKKDDLPSTITNLLQVIDYDEIPTVNSRKFDRWIKTQRHGDRQPILAS